LGLVAIGGGGAWVLDLKRIGRREGVLEGFIERLFLVPAIAVGAIVILRSGFAFWLDNHLDLSASLLKIVRTVKGNEPSRAYVPRTSAKNS
jgi:hypothetical protein